MVPENSSAYLVEEIQLSPEPEPVRNLQLAPTQVRRDPNRIWSFCGDELGSLGQALGLLTPLFSSRVLCSQASQEASGKFLRPIAESMRAVWTVSLPGTLTVPGTLSQAFAAFCLALPRECWSWMGVGDNPPWLSLHSFCHYSFPLRGTNTFTPRFHAAASSSRGGLLQGGFEGAPVSFTWWS